MEGQLVFPGAQVPSVNKMLRVLKREESSLFNCAASCIDDAEFVGQMGQLYPALPRYANLRCGLWYLERPDSTCYFKVQRWGLPGASFCRLSQNGMYGMHGLSWSKGVAGCRAAALPRNTRCLYKLCLHTIIACWLNYKELPPATGPAPF